MCVVTYLVNCVVRVGDFTNDGERQIVWNAEERHEDKDAGYCSFGQTHGPVPLVRGLCATLFRRHRRRRRLRQVWFGCNYGSSARQALNWTGFFVLFGLV